MGIQFKDGKILFVDGKIALDPACCCGGCGCCECDQLRYDAIFSGDMDELSGTYTSVRKESYGEEGCEFFFDEDSPIGSIYFDCEYGGATIRAQTVSSETATYYAYGDADFGSAFHCPAIFYDPWMLEWATWSPEYPPPQFWADYLRIYCADPFEAPAPGWVQDGDYSEEIP